MTNLAQPQQIPSKPLGPRALETRRKIVETALGLIIEHGESGVNMTEICQAVDISRTTMYRHFSSLDDIIMAVYLNVRETFATGLQDAIDNDPAEDRRLDVVVDYLCGFFNQGIVQKLSQTNPNFLRALSLENFDSRIALYEQVLAPFFDLAERQTGNPVDRHLVGYFITHFYASLTLYGTHSKPYEIDVLMRKLIVGLTFQGHAAP